MYLIHLRASEINPTRTFVTVDLLHLSADIKHYEEAIDNFVKALELIPKNEKEIYLTDQNLQDTSNSTTDMTVRSSL